MRTNARTLLKPTCSQRLKSHHAIRHDTHISKYDMTDVAILSECRTIVPSGFVGKNIDTAKLIEIDRTKPFTWAFTQIKFTPVFNEFDI